VLLFNLPEKSSESRETKESNRAASGAINSRNHKPQQVDVPKRIGKQRTANPYLNVNQTRLFSKFIPDLHNTRVLPVSE